MNTSEIIASVAAIISLISVVVATFALREGRKTRLQSLRVTEFAKRSEALMKLNDAESAALRAQWLAAEISARVQHAMTRYGLSGSGIEILLKRTTDLENAAKEYRARAERIRGLMKQFNNETRLDQYETVISESHEIIVFFENHMRMASDIQRDLSQLLTILGSADKRGGK